MDRDVAWLSVAELRAAIENGEPRQIRDHCRGGLFELEAAMKLVQTPAGREKSDEDAGFSVNERFLIFPSLAAGSGRY
jgi:hypothetical protein